MLTEDIELELDEQEIDICVTMIGALPPLKGNAYYCMGLAREISKRTRVDFISFKKLYPDFLYPGGGIRLRPRIHYKSNPYAKYSPTNHLL